MTEGIDSGILQLRVAPAIKHRVPIYVLLAVQAIDSNPTTTSISFAHGWELCWSQSPSPASIACRMRWLARMHTTTFLDCKCAPAVAPAQHCPHQCLARVRHPPLCSTSLPRQRQPANPRLIRRLHATIRNPPVSPPCRPQPARDCVQLIRWLGGCGPGHGHDTPWALQDTLISEPKIPPELLTPGSPRGHKHSRQTAHMGATWIWTFQTPRLAGNLCVATLAGWMSQLFPFGTPLGAALVLFTH